jgi:hypothetical protein
MRPRINYHTTVNLWLHCEDFQNAGYTSEQIKNVIEKHNDYNGLPFRCRPIGINGNWIIETIAHDPFQHEVIVNELTHAILAEKPHAKTTR